MPNRHLAIALSLAASACTTSPPTTTSTVIEESSGSKCDPSNYPCDPMDPFANGVCEWICGNGEEGAGHCHPYTSVEEVWCASHPGGFMTSGKYCDLRGNPMWDTHCVPGWLP